MEAVEDPPVQFVQSTVESVKLNTANDVESITMKESNLCHTSNGVNESTATPTDTINRDDGVVDTAESVNESVLETHPNYVTPTESTEAAATSDASVSKPPEEEILTATETHSAVENLLSDVKTSEAIVEEIIETETIQTSEAILCNEVTIEGSTVVEDDPSANTVTLCTEILVEKSEDDISDQNEMIINNHDTSNNILDFGNGMELSEVLRSSDTTDHGENNNGSAGEEIFNKEELLDILEGNDEMPHTEIDEQIQDPNVKRRIETQIALKQLSRLQKHRAVKHKGESKDSSNVVLKDGTPKKRRGKKKDVKTPEKQISSESKVQKVVDKEYEKAEVEPSASKTEENKNESIVKTLVKDWDDDEPADADVDQKLKESVEECEHVSPSNKSLDKSQVLSTSVNQESMRKSTDSPTGEGPTAGQNKSGDESQPQRRLGRVIKKKVPFDPDNPDTFTKSKVGTKAKETQLEKEQPPPKKQKSEVTPPRPKSKSPIGKQQWKKPAVKNISKHNKRLSEVDKLLMDEGAVNMIYQLTPEAPKGKKNMRTKAEIIKKMQSSTPEGNKEMKFRERKKETKEAKQIVGGKSTRSSLSGSIKSPAVSEDFETHSADDSIIYRRHSSSSYSSSCMSPRRLSELETGNAQAPIDSLNNTLEGKTEDEKPTDVFMADVNDTSNEIINKDDCLSIKDKLNTKLSLALNKRKRESTTKTEKLPKQKRAVKNTSVEKESNVKIENINNYKHISVKFDQRLAEICIRKSGSICSLEMLKEFEQALLLVDDKKDVSVTLLTSECGTLCSELDLSPLSSESMEIRTNYAHAIADGVRSLLCCVDGHGKLLVSGVWGACAGLGVALAALSDVALAAEHATFEAGTAPPLLGTAALTSRLSHSLINDLVIFGRRLSCAEAVSGGLASRAVPAPAAGCVRQLAAHLAADPPQTVMLKKQLLNLKRSSDSTSTFQSGLERERDLLVAHWTSTHVQDTLRAANNQ